MGASVRMVRSKIAYSTMFLRTVYTVFVIGSVLAPAGGASARDVSDLFPRSASLIPIAPPNKFLSILRGIRASVRSLPPTAYVDTEVEATQLLVQLFANSPPIACTHSGVSIASTSGWYPYPNAPLFLKDWLISYTETCVRSGQTYVRNLTTTALTSGFIGCTNIDDEIRSRLPDGKFYTPYDPVDCVSRLRIDHPPCCDNREKFAYSPMITGNPVNFGLGRKVLIETDYTAPADSRLTLQRYYEVHVSTPYLPSKTGRDWSHSFNRALFDAGNAATGVYSIGISEPNGHWTWFTPSGSGYVSMYHPADTPGKGGPWRGSLRVAPTPDQRRCRDL